MTRIATLPDDEKFPQLPAVIDLAAMQARLQRQLPGFAEGRWQIKETDIAEFDYKPGKKCCICYALTFAEKTTGLIKKQLMLGIIFSDDELEANFAKAQRHAVFQPAFAPKIYLLRELNMVLWGFPNDPKIKHLAALVDKSSLRALLQKNWERLQLSPEITLREVATEIVKYVPQRRCTFRHTLYLQKSDGATEKLVIYSKIYDDKTDGEPFFKIIENIWHAPVCQSGALLIPEPLFFDRETNTGFQRGLHGQNLDLLLDQIDLDDLSQKIGAALAELHQCPLEGLEGRPFDYELAEFLKTRQSLEKINAAYQAKLNFIEDALRKNYAALTALSPAPIHGAFRLTQLLLVDGRLALIDFDGFLMGNPLADAGSFIAHLLYLPLKGLITPGQGRTAVRLFCQAYLEKADWGLPAEVLHWYTAANLAGREVRKCLDKSSKISKRDYEGMIEVLLDMAVDILSGKVPLL